MRRPERWRRSDAVLWREVLDDAVLLPPGATEVVALTGGAGLWEVLKQPSTIVELVRVLGTTDEAGTTESLVRLLDELSAAGALERLPG